jgi:sugar lactone lactonase YvrE
MAATVGVLHYELVDAWEKLPDDLHHGDVAGVGVDSQDRVFLLTRRDERVIVYDRDGTFLAAWGEDLFTARPHGLTVAPDDTLYCVDEGQQVVYHLTSDGSLLDTLGTPGVSSDTGYDGSSLASVVRGGPPFNKPTNLAVAPSGDLYVSDGYGNARVHRFSSDGHLIQSWGEPGSGVGQFNLVHGIAITRDGRVMVADRENDRIQAFSADGDYLAEWTDVQRPTNIALDMAGNVYVSELWRRPGEESLRLGPTRDDRPGRVSIYDSNGGVLARWGGSDPSTPGTFIAPHDICVDSRGDMYVAEVTWTHATSRGYAPDGSPALQKFARIRSTKAGT